MPKELNGYIREIVESNAYDECPVTADELIRAARRFHRYYPDVVTPDGVASVAQSCLESCGLAVCLHPAHSGCYGGTAFVNTKCQLEGEIGHYEKNGPPEVADHHRGLLDDWTNL